MNESTAQLSGPERSLCEEELGLLERVQTSLAQARVEAERRARERRIDADPVAAVRALRDEAATASEDDLPALLHELSVRHSLLVRPAADLLPDPEHPYIAHLRLSEGGVTKDYCLGQRTHLEASSGVRVVDWRVAPVARIFYGYAEGDEYEEEYPGRTAEGQVLARRIVVIDAGRLRQVVSDGVVLSLGADGFWRSQPRNTYALSGGGAGSAARAEARVPSASTPSPSVTALLDAQQYAAISAPPERPLLVLGSAGSGKTTVALHRLARIESLDPERYPLERCWCWSPRRAWPVCLAGSSNP